MDNFWILFLAFTIYSFLGWLIESIFCSVPAGYFINRGFLNGPFCPIYGVGGVIVVSVLTPFKEHLIALYAASVIITTLLEYLTGFVLEKTFHTKYWDYSHHRFNIQGRVCMKNSLLFGVMCVVGMLYIQPVLMRFLHSIPEDMLPMISIVFIIYFICDTTVTVSSVCQLNGKLDEMQTILDEIKEKVSDLKAEKFENIQATIGGLIEDGTKAAYLKTIRELYEKKENLETEIKSLQLRVINAFPTMKSIKSNESLQRMKEIIYDKTKAIRRK